MRPRQLSAPAVPRHGPPSTLVVLHPLSRTGGAATSALARRALAARGWRAGRAPWAPAARAAARARRPAAARPAGRRLP
eukprot:scaffold45147_cov48-Phaeocystis_antarctica.AAC.2